MQLKAHTYKLIRDNEERKTRVTALEDIAWLMHSLVETRITNKCVELDVTMDTRHGELRQQLAECVTRFVR